uniref:Macro domain-containing protein n=1 Tax=Amphilophus citrinellus TaxID=61819 RepID=A0A3Q0R704_AMPCI
MLVILQIFSGTMDSILDIPLHGASLNIVKQCGPGLNEILDSKFGCVATFEGMDFENGSSFGQQKRQTVAKDKRFSVKLRAGVEVSVWKADLTDFPVDAVVNAANCFLQHNGGLAQALCAAGGPQIQMESDRYTKQYGPLETGKAIVANAGFLPCKKIIHAVGPQLVFYPSSAQVSQARPRLKKAIWSILDRVKENHLDTVAIPAISSGLFNYPLPECAETIVSTVKDYYEQSSSREHLPKEIFFVNHDELTVTEMEKATGRITRGATKTSNIPIQIGNVLLTLKRDSIEEQKMDVIVNTTSLERDLNSGQVSKALLKKAGQRMQSEIRSAPRTKHIIITNAYNLQCKEVYHTFCINNGQEASHKVHYNVSLDSNKSNSAAKHHKSIAFPAIGTGNLGFTKKEAACIMSEAVVDFAKTFSGKMDVYFVIFPSDSDTFQVVFQKSVVILQQGCYFLPSPAEYDDKDVRFNRSPRISLNGPSKESLCETEKWLTSLLFRPPRPVLICNNFIQHLSEKEYVQLSCLTRKGVMFEEFLTKGHACLTVNGNSIEDVVVAAVQVEAMLCTVQKEFVTEEEKEMCKLLPNDVPLERERKTVDDSSPEFRGRFSAFKKLGLWILKVDKVENPALKLLFELKKQQLGCSSEKMFQRIPAQFCRMINPKYGEGIYFARTVKKAMEVWREKNDQYLYFVEAEVLTGKSTLGKPGLILPPAVGPDPLVRFDSVSGESDISVIFSSYQALPRYIITCMIKTELPCFARPLKRHRWDTGLPWVVIFGPSKPPDVVVHSDTHGNEGVKTIR